MDYGDKASRMVLASQVGHKYGMLCPLPLENSPLINKNAAKRSRQHAGEKYREYAQRSVCFVKKQVP